MKKNKKVDIDVFSDAQEKLYEYIDWLYNTDRLTTEEYNTLINSTGDCVMKAIIFGSKEVK